MSKSLGPAENRNIVKTAYVLKKSTQEHSGRPDICVKMRCLYDGSEESLDMSKKFKFL
jgi:hypothetical protein